MPKFKGKDLIVKIGNGASPEVYSTVAALKTLSLQIGRNTVDVTNKDSQGWQELLGDAAIANGTISGSGLWTDVATQEAIRAAVISGASKNLQLFYGSGDHLDGAFIITSFELTGGYDDAQAFSFTAQSNGALTYTNGS